MMMGAAYTLGAERMEAPAPPAAIGAIAGVFFIYLTHRAVGTSELELNRLEDADPVYGYQVLMVGSLHSASEGIAIAVAMIVDLRLGIFMALAIAVHNIPEATVQTAVLRGQGVALHQAAGLAVATNFSQILMAVATYSVVSAAPAALPWVQGFAVGALVQLTLLELLPESYRQAGKTSIALATVVALGVVVLAQSLLA
jgi:zinc transporter ZupT